MYLAGVRKNLASRPAVALAEMLGKEMVEAKIAYYRQQLLENEIALMEQKAILKLRIPGTIRDAQRRRKELREERMRLRARLTPYFNGGVA